MVRHVIWQIVTDVSEVLNASIFRGEDDPEDESSMFLRNVSVYLNVRTVPEPRTPTAITQLWQEATNVASYFEGVTSNYLKRK
jgi:hypothetical protein